MNPELKYRCLVTVEAEADPQLPGRILDLLAVRNHPPDWFSVRRRDAATIRICVELADTDEDASTLLARRILRIPSVLEVSRAWLGKRDQVAA